MKRRAAVEPGIAHLKREYHMDRNRLKGTVGDGINAPLSAAGMNFSKLVKAVAVFLRRIFGSRFSAAYGDLFFHGL